MSQANKLLRYLVAALVIVNLKGVPVTINGHTVGVGETATFESDLNITVIIEEEGVGIYGTK